MINFSKKILLIRHAESIANAGYPTTFHDSIPLSEKGIIQAKELPQKLSLIPSLIISSPFLRAIQTAIPIVDYFKNVTYELNETIYEMNILATNRCVNTTTIDRKKFVDEYWANANPNYNDGDGAESFVVFISRVKNFIIELENKRESIIFVVGHGKFFQGLLWCINNKVEDATQELMQDFVKYFSTNYIENTEGILLVHHAFSWDILK